MVRMAKKYDGKQVVVRIDAATDGRLEKLVPTYKGARAPFIRRAIRDALDRAEAEQDGAA